MALLTNPSTVAGKAKVPIPISDRLWGADVPNPGDTAANIPHGVRELSHLAALARSCR